MPGKVAVYNVTENERVEMYQIDARDAVKNHPDEWSYEPWKEPKKKASAKTSAESAPSTDVVTERAGPTRLDGPETPGAQTDISSPTTPAPVEDSANELGQNDVRQGIDTKTATLPELRDYIEQRSGKRPANFVKEPELRQKAAELQKIETGEGKAG